MVGLYLESVFAGLGSPWDGQSPQGQQGPTCQHFKVQKTEDVVNTEGKVGASCGSLEKLLGC